MKPILRTEQGWSY